MARPRARRFSGMSSAYAGVFMRASCAHLALDGPAGKANGIVGNGAGLAGDKSKTFGIGAANASGVPIDGNTFGSLRLGVSDPSYPKRPSATTGPELAGGTFAGRLRAGALAALVGLDHASRISGGSPMGARRIMMASAPGARPKPRMRCRSDLSSGSAAETAASLPVSNASSLMPAPASPSCPTGHPRPPLLPHHSARTASIPASAAASSR